MTEDLSAAGPAAEVLRSAGIAFTVHLCSPDEGVAIADCARELHIDEHAIAKTLLLEADGDPFLVLMHGDMRASAKDLAETMGAKSVTPCPPDKAHEYTGYHPGRISPLGVRRQMRIFTEETLLNLRKIYVNGGRRGYLLGIDPEDLAALLHPVLVRVGSSRA